MKHREFNIPIAGLKDKVYQFEYELNDSFFDTATEPLVSEPDIQVHITFDKTKEPYVLDISISGTFMGECDRCASELRIPVEGDFRLYVKFGQAEETVDETEVVYISREDHEILLYEHLYDFAHLSIPMVKRCSTPADKTRCDEKIESYLTKAPVQEDLKDPRWEALKKLKK
jgi:uncharacterized metal-binding protein YceD (DUF177 family)